MVKSKDTESKILEAARSVFIKKGFSGARMQEIADEADINKALLHYYFRSKEKLFDTIFEEAFFTISKGLGQLAESKQPALVKLEQMIGMYVDVISANPYLPNFVLNEIARNPDRMQRILSKGVFPSLIGFFAELLQEMNLGNIRAIHPSHLLLNVIGMIVIPYAGKPMLAPVFSENLGVDYDDILAERKRVIINFVFNALNINNHEV